jgi:hypothetical protein
MHAALHDDVAAVPGEVDGVTCTGLGKRRPVEHDEHVIAIPFIDLQIVGYGVKIYDCQWVKFPHDRYEGHELTDIRFQFRFRKLEGFAFLNIRDRHDYIFETLLCSNGYFSKQPVPGPIG